MLCSCVFVVRCALTIFCLWGILHITIFSLIQDGGCGLNLCHNCVDQEECRTTWFLCPHNKSGTSAGAKNDCVSRNPVKFCSDCTDVESKARKLYHDSDDDEGVSDMEHQKNHALIYCGGFDRGSCMAAGSVRKTVKECRECALSGERMMRICYCCGKIRCISCIGLARDQGGDMMGETNSGWNILAEMGLGDDEGMGMGDMMKAQFINDFIKRCGDCGRDVCMECTSEETLASNMSKARLFDCKESGCRCVSCMTRERMASKIEDDTSFKCDECRQAKLKCHNPGCNNRYKFFCTRCGKANYCSREVRCSDLLCQTLLQL